MISERHSKSLLTAVLPLGTFVIALLVLAPACPPTPTPPVNPDASDAALVLDANDVQIVLVPDDAADEDGRKRKDASVLDSGPNDACAQACASLSAHSECPDGKNVAACVVACRKGQGVVTNFNPSCVAKAKTVADIRACSPSVCR